MDSIGISKLTQQALWPQAPKGFKKPQEAGPRFGSGSLFSWRKKDLPKPPRVAIVDDFSQPLVDIDGDWVNDLSHGETIERMIRALRPDVTIERFVIKLGKDATVFRDNLIQQWQQLLKRVQAGESFAAINFSVAYAYPFLKLLTPLPQVTADNLHRWRQPVSNHLRPDPQLRGFSDVISMFQELVRQQMPIFISGGNEGPRYFNPYNLIQGTHGVRATDARGKTSLYSADNTLLNQTAQGDFAITKVADGFDITGDGKTDVYDHEVSGGKPYISQFVGKPALQVKASKWQQASMLFKIATKPSSSYSPAVVFPLEPLALMGQMSLRTYNYYRQSGVRYFSVYQGRPSHGFKVDGQGRLVYDPDNSGRPNAVNLLSGTSFAAPVALVRYLNKVDADAQQKRH